MYNELLTSVLIVSSFNKLYISYEISVSGYTHCLTDQFPDTCERQSMTSRICTILKTYVVLSDIII